VAGSVFNIKKLVVLDFDLKLDIDLKEWGEILLHGELMGN
jgi:hypothetical protein